MTDTTGAIFIRGGIASPDPDPGLPPVDEVEPGTVVLGENGTVYVETDGEWTARPHCGISERQQIEQQTRARERHDDHIAHLTRHARAIGGSVGVLVMIHVFALATYLFTLTDLMWVILEVLIAITLALGAFGICDIVTKRVVKRITERESAHAPEAPARLPDDTVVVPDEIADEARRRSGQAERSVVA